MKARLTSIQIDRAKVYPPNLAIIAVIGLCLLTVGCATSGYTGYRTIERPPQRVGPVSESFIEYSSLTGEHFPTEGAPFLKVILKKRLEAQVRYEARTYQERIYKKQRSKIEANLLPLSCVAGMSLFFGEPYSDYALPAAGIAFLLVPPPDPKYSYTYVHGSEDVIVTYRDEVITVPAPEEVLIAKGTDTVTTNQNGAARFHVIPSQCDSGVVVAHPESGTSYLVKRVLKERKITKDWVETAQLLNNLVGSAVTIAKLTNMASAGAGTEVMVLTVIVDAITGVVIDFVIEKLGTSTEQYYAWLIIVRT